MQKNNERIGTRLDLTVCIVSACLFLILFGVLIDRTSIIPLYAVLLCSFLYLFTLFLWACLRLGTDSLVSRRRLRMAFGEELEKVVSDLAQPAFLCEKSGRIVWCNSALVNIIGRRDLVLGAQIDDVCSISEEDVAKQDGSALAGIGDRLFHYEGIRVGEGEGELWFVIFTDCTEHEQLIALHAAKTSVVAYIVIDNLNELMQYVQDSYSSATLAVEDVIKNWVRDMGGVVKGYEKDKYVAFFEMEKLADCIARSFDVLDNVRRVRVGDGMPITVSIGVSAMGKTPSEKEAAAQAALDMALQRGGDQAVVRSENGDEFFGGKTKAVQKRVNVRSRVVANELTTLMARTDSVLIMGHRFGDFDSFGSSVGIARLAISCGIRPHIVVNRRDPNLAPCFEKLADIADYEDIFVDAAEGMNLVCPDTLLIVVDTSNFEITECPDLIKSVRTVAIIDHHRKNTEFDKEPKIAYIEPSASSASELVAEILEQHMTSKNLLKEEAELMLAGILLDTKQFTRNTGTRTFGAALYLRGEGAIPGESSDLFRADVDDLTKEARFHTNVMIYRSCVAITHVDGETDASYRVIASKAADKLLTVRGVSASFALTTIDKKVHISARSDGSINVQLVLAALNGGGHFDSAGAQVEGQTMNDVILALRASIDNYLDNMLEKDR